MLYRLLFRVIISVQADVVQCPICTGCCYPVSSLIIQAALLSIDLLRGGERERARI